MLMAEQFPRFEPGPAELSAEALNRQAAVLETLAGGIGAVGQSRFGAVVLPTDDGRRLWIRLTDWASYSACSVYGVYVYPWEEVVWDAATCSWVTMSGGRSGTVADVPAVAASGSRIWPPGTVAKAWFARDDRAVVFRRCRNCPQCPTCDSAEGYTTVCRVTLSGFSGTYADGAGDTFEFAELNDTFVLASGQAIGAQCNADFHDYGKQLPHATEFKHARVQYLAWGGEHGNPPTSLEAGIYIPQPFPALPKYERVRYEAVPGMYACGVGSVVLNLVDIGRATTAPAAIAVEYVRMTFDCRSIVWSGRTEPLVQPPFGPQCVSNAAAIVRRTGHYLWEGASAEPNGFLLAPVRRYQAAYRLDVSGDPYILDYWDNAANWLAGAPPLARGVLPLASFNGAPGASNFFPLIAIPASCPTLTGLWLDYVGV